MNHPSHSSGLASASPPPMRGDRRRKSHLSGIVAIIALLLLVATGSTLMTSIGQALRGGSPVDPLAAATLVLNLALIAIGWFRHAALSREVSRSGMAEAHARQMADRDPLTGFLNRRAFAGEGDTLIARARRKGQSVAVLAVDLDNFKNINDLHGHATGDALLLAVSTEIGRAIPDDAIVARLGGDEFACALLFDARGRDNIARTAEQIVSRLSLPFDAAGIHAHISASVGIACTSDGQESIEALMRRADIAMYAAKNSGRNRHCWFDSSMERALELRNAIEAGLKIGIPRGEFVPYYEQQIDLSTGRLHGFEVLARWNSAAFGLMAPDTFVPVAEETGMISDLSLAIIKQALEHGRDWDQALTLSVNISPTQLKDPWLSQKLVKLLVETGFPPSRLEVEITESALFENLGLAQSIVGSLKNQGIQLALDDFGTGYSSLAHLRALPFDRIKIDRSFVSSINENAESAAIVNAITRLSDSLGLPVTAEGVETGAIEQRLRTLGVHKGQGWHFGKPMPIDQVNKLLAEKNLLPARRAAIELPQSETVRRFPRVG